MNSVNTDTYTNDKTIECKCNTNWLTIEYKLTVNGVEIDCNLSITWLPMECQSTVNWKPIDFQLETHSVRPGLYSIESISKQAPRTFPSIEGNTRGANLVMNSVNAYGIPKRRQLIANVMPMYCQLDSNWLSIECNWVPIGTSVHWTQSQ